MRPTQIGTLLGVGVVAAPAGWLLGRAAQATSGTLPGVPWVLPLVLVFMTLLLLGGARAVRGWVRERRYEGRMDALLVARLLALGKAAAVFGAVVTGAYAGLAILALDVLAPSVGRERAALSALVAAAGILVTVAGLRLERACVVPPDDETDRDQPRLG